MKTMRSLFAFIVAAWYICHTEGFGCTKSFGPPGTTQCIKLPGYYGFQWATCRSDVYIRLNSNNAHWCRDRSATYCYYQCMVEVYSQNSGNVLSRCSCSPFSPQPTEGVKLPSRCFSPNGSDCTWYKECLNKAYPSCHENNENDYAIKFSEKFCELSNEMNLKISDEGMRWVDGVRKCLQIKLVPLLGQTRVHTCGELKLNTFKTHASCFLKPDQTSPSLCSLSTLEQLKVFWTIKSAFPDQTFWPSLKSMLDEIGGCIQAKPNSRVQEVKANIEEKVKNDTGRSVLEKTEVRINAWLEDPIPPIQLEMFIRDGDWHNTKRSYFAGKVVDAMVLKQMWKDEGVAWFAYENTKSIRLLVADRSKYETPGAFGKTSSFTKPADITALLLQLSKDVYNGTLNLQVSGDSVQIVSVHGCLDWNCNELAFDVKSQIIHERNAAESHKATSTLSFSFLGFFIINFLFTT